ncbi:MAG: TSUP family transporter [Cyanobacteria bacterium P01_F01_bin.53]
MVLFAIFCIGLAAGFVDAIAGGGGLIMLPGLLLTGLPVGGAIATNKLCGTCGAIASSLKFATANQVDWRACRLMALPIILGSFLGSRSIGLLPTTWAEPLVIFLMTTITLFVVFNPDFGMSSVPAVSIEQSSPQQTYKRVALSLLLGLVIGFHDGFFGPGTGVFLVFVLLSLWSQGFLRATGSAKILNLLANATALITFALSGNISYSKGIAGALGVTLGAYLGATLANKKGAKLIKPLFVTVTTILIIKLLFNYLTP